MAKMPPYSAHSDFEFGNASLFIVEFMGGESSALNLIKGTFPATNVSVSGANPEYDKIEIAGVETEFFKGSTPPTQISITFLDNAKDELFLLLNRWAGRGSLDGNKTQYKRINRIAKIPTSSVKIKVTELDPQGNETQANIYIVQAPKDALKKDLGKADVKSYSVDFNIVGIV